MAGKPCRIQVNKSQSVEVLNVKIPEEIVRKFSELPGRSRSKDIWTAVEDAILVKYWPTHTTREISAVIGKSIAAIRGRRKLLIERGLTK